MKRKESPELLEAAVHCLSSFSCDQFQLHLVLHVASWEMELRKKMSRTAEGISTFRETLRGHPCEPHEAQQGQLNGPVPEFVPNEGCTG